MVVLFRWIIFSLLFLRLTTGGASNSTSGVPPLSTGESAGDISKTLEILIELIVQPKNFRATTAEIEKIVKPYCQRVAEYESDNSYSSRYKCGNLLQNIEVELFVVGNKRPEAYVRKLEIIFPIAFFEKSKLQMRRKLGKPAQARIDMIRWTYEKDRYINRFGTPVFIASPFPDEGIASVELALESGP